MYDKQEEHVRSPGIGITRSFELSYGYWEPKQGPLGEQQVPLTAEPALQPLWWGILIINLVEFRSTWKQISRLVCEI